MEVKSYIDRKLVLEQQRMFNKSRILMLENVCWVKQKSGKKMEAKSNFLK